MTITTEDIVMLTPTAEDIRLAVRYAIKSGGAYTYNRMSKDAWRRVARVARGKVNESVFARHIESFGILPVTQEDKSYRQHDAFDYTFNGQQGEVEIDVKTFHVLTQFIKSPRELFAFNALLSGVRHDSDDWHLFFPMLVPLDYKKHKDVYVFAVSVEDKFEWSAEASLEYPWMAFPEGEDEDFLINPDAIKAREKDEIGLNVTVSWQQGMEGEGSAVFERNGESRLKKLSFHGVHQVELTRPSSFLAIQLDDRARKHLKNEKTSLTLTAQEADNPETISQFDVKRFREVFPRQGYTLYLLGWIGREDFNRSAQELPSGSSCYFYPPARPSGGHAPGTKTENRYVLPGELNPINTLKKV